MPLRPLRSLRDRTSLSELLVDVLGAIATRTPSEYVAEVIEVLRKELQAPWLALFVARGEIAERVALAKEPERPSQASSSRLRASSGSLPEAIAVARLRDTARIVTLDEAAGLYLLTPAPDLARIYIDADKRSVRATARVIRVLLDALERRTASWSSGIERVATNREAAAATFLGIALRALDASAGSVVLIDGDVRAVLAHRGAVSASGEGVAVDTLMGERIARVQDAQVLAPGAASIFVLARPLGEAEASVVLVVARQTGVIPHDAEAIARVDKVIDVMRALLVHELTKSASGSTGSEVDPVLDALLALVDATFGAHHSRVAHEADRIALRFTLDPRERAMLFRAARLHDVGRLEGAADPIAAWRHPSGGVPLLQALGEPERVVALVHACQSSKPRECVHPPVDDLAAWALVVAEAVVERAERTGASMVDARSGWMSEALGGLPASVLSRLVHAIGEGV